MEEGSTSLFIMDQASAVITGQPSNKWLIPPPTAPPFLIARNTPFGHEYRLNLVERACNHNWHRAFPDGRFRATVNLFHLIKAFLRARNTPFGRGYCLNLVKRARNRTVIERPGRQVPGNRQFVPPD
ncbi:hypothetical protein CEXT_326521 [Caerostris extrusa]|uniref:Uncharacterized protein n=1 Tax=Caerostris extrusa TaxID=172846 RepID=A0AAV4XCW3_CAEEX|nr:hypothetical protein CEXT_326521 [Caerostris extrusa]